MRFHWFINGSPEPKEYYDLTEKINDSGYYSVLYVYHSVLPDNLLKVVRSANSNHKFKYMIAMRTYAISPEYLTMLSRAFEELFPNRLMINILAGDLHQEENLKNGVVDYDENQMSLYERIKFTNKFLEKFVTEEIKEICEIVVAGKSKEALESSRQYGDYCITMIDQYMDILADEERKKILDGIDKRIVSVSILLDSDLGAAEEKYNSLPERFQRWTIYGNRDKIIKNIFDFKNIGITDVMVHPSKFNTEDDIHSLVKHISMIQ